MADAVTRHYIGDTLNPHEGDLTPVPDKNFTPRVVPDEADEIFPIRFIGQSEEEEVSDFRPKMSYDFSDEGITEVPAPKDLSAPESADTSASPETQTDPPQAPPSADPVPVAKEKPTPSESSSPTS